MAALLLAASVATEIHSDVVGDYAVGRAGEALKRTLRQHCAPTSAVDRTTLSPSDYLDILAEQQTAADGMGRVADAVTGRTCSAAEVHTQLTTTTILPGDWFGYPPAYRTGSAADLYNNIATIPEVMQAHSTALAWASAATATEVVEGDGWRTGLLYFSNWGDVPVLEPADEAKGALARRIMYVATVYPASAWHGDAPKFFTVAEYPGLTSFAVETYLGWHRDCPVTDAERLANDAVEKRQGNRNPFVDYPDLAEYLWGEYAGEMYPGETTIGGDQPGDQPGDEPGGKPDDNPGDDTPEVRIPLRGVYSLASDGYLDLYSPYVPDDAAWTIDGTAVDDVRVDLTSLGVGSHELKYSGKECAGKLMIEIRP